MFEVRCSRRFQISSNGFCPSLCSLDTFHRLSRVMILIHVFRHTLTFLHVSVVLPVDYLNINSNNGSIQDD